MTRLSTKELPYVDMQDIRYFIDYQLEEIRYFHKHKLEFVPFNSTYGELLIELMEEAGYSIYI
jgi:hypothetical protein